MEKEEFALKKKKLIKGWVISTAVVVIILVVLGAVVIALYKDSNFANVKVMLFWCCWAYGFMIIFVPWCHYLSYKQDLKKLETEDK